MWLIVVAVLSVLLVLMMNKRPATVEKFESLGAGPVARYTSSNALSCLAAAVDKNIPIKTGYMQTVPAPASYITDAMVCAVGLINTRCATDFFKVAVDVPKREDDAAGNIQCTGRVHVYSPRLNVAHTITIQTLQNPLVPRVYLKSAVPLGCCADDDSGIEAAPCSDVGRSSISYSAYSLL